LQRGGEDAWYGEREDEVGAIHGELTAAAPHLEQELERVQQKDRNWDVKDVERAIQRELEMRRS